MFAHFARTSTAFALLLSDLIAPGLQGYERIRLRRLAEGLCLALQRPIPVFGLVDAAGLRGQRIARESVGAGARAAANLLVLAGAALAFQPAGVPQRLENGSVA